MNTGSKSPPAGPALSEPNSRTVAERVREPVPRRVFIAMRLKEISDQVGMMAQEREGLTSELKSRSDNEGVAHKRLRQRRAYLAERLDMLRREQSELNTERKVLGPADPAAEEKSRSARRAISGSRMSA